MKHSQFLEVAKPLSYSTRRPYLPVTQYFILDMPAPTFLAQSLTELIALRAKQQPDDPAVHTGVPQFAELQTLR